MAQNSELDYQRKQLQTLVQDITNPEQLRIIDRILTSRSTLEEKIAAIHGIIHDSNPKPILSKVEALESVGQSQSQEPETSNQESDLGNIEQSNSENPPDSNPTFSSQYQEPLEEIEYKSPSDSIRATFQQIYKNRKKLKADITPGNLFQYVLQDLWKVLIFARDTQCIQGKLLYLFLHFPEDGAWEYIQNLQKKTLPYLKENLDQLEKKAWLFLEKQEFNGLMVLKDLVTNLLDISQESLKLEHYKDHPLVKLEPNYLTLRYLSKEVYDFGAIIQKIYRTLPDLPGSPATIISSIEKLLQEDLSKKNLGNFILSLNMIAFYRFLTLDDLTQSPPGELISSAEFNCADSIQVEIRKYLKELEFRLSSGLKRRDGISLQQSQEDSDPDSDLAFFYSYGDDLLQKAHTILDPKKRGLKTNDDQSQSFEKDKHLPLLFLLRFSSRWIHTVKPMLNGTIPMTNGIKRIFHQDVFGSYFDKIETSLGALGTYLQKYGTITQEQLQSTGNTQSFLEKVGGTVDELKELLHLFDHCIFQYQQIYQVLSSVLKKHTGSVLTSNPIPINSRLISGEKLTIPHIQELIDQRDTFMGKSLGESLFIIQEILIQFLNLTKPKALEVEQVTREEIDLELRSLQKSIRRIGNPEYYKKIREKYSLRM